MATDTQCTEGVTVVRTLSSDEADSLWLGGWQFHKVLAGKFYGSVHGFGSLMGIHRQLIVVVFRTMGGDDVYLFKVRTFDKEKNSPELTINALAIFPSVESTSSRARASLEGQEKNMEVQ